MIEPSSKSNSSNDNGSSQTSESIKSKRSASIDEENKEICDKLSAKDIANDNNKSEENKSGKLIYDMINIIKNNN